MRAKTITAERPPARPQTTEATDAWIAALEVAQGILHDAAQTPREYVQRLHVEKGGE